MKRLALTLAVLLATALLGGALLMATDLDWPLPPSALIPLGAFVLALGALAILALLGLAFWQQLVQQQRALRDSLDALAHHGRTQTTALLAEHFMQHVERLLEKEGLDPNKRNVLRCLSIDALRGNSGRGDPNYARLARLFEWFDGEARATDDGVERRRLLVPVLMQYADVAVQLCRVGESEEERLGEFLSHQPPAATQMDDATPTE
ncbi:hypothetical protein [Chromohalobacter canadensis]|uniref:hypothetical protein n=1 Tax=Chromohalobacter canadensis TaxID=141389 RepID=UPI00240EE850|nr:hypothetical protein [Chromohalobacter canadensis]